MDQIAVLDYRLHPEAQDAIRLVADNEVVFYKDRCPENERVSRTGEANIVLLTPWEKVDKDYLDACPNLKYVGLCGTSTANIDLKELEDRGIAFSNIVSDDKESVAEFFFMQLVCLARGIGQYQWKLHEEHELVDRRIGIIGLGKVGQAMAHMALAYKMDVTYNSPHRKQDWEDKGLSYLDKDELLKTSEIIVICSPSNVRVIDDDEFKLMRPGSIIVQASSGTPFNQAVLIEWVSHDNNYAMFDMSASEKNYQIYKDVPRIIFSKMVAGDTYESNARRGERAVANLNNYLNSRANL